MPPSLRDLVGDIREAVERLPREALVDILVYVFKEYVVEGSAPLATAATAAHDELAGRSFAELIRELQLRLADQVPELELFDVQGERVSVRIGGRAVPLEVPAARASQAAVPAPMATPAPAPSLPPVEAPAAAPPAVAARPVAPAASGARPAAPPAASVAPTAPASSSLPAPGKGLLEID